MLQGADAAALDDEEQELLSLLAEDEQPTGELLVQGGSAGDPLSGDALLNTAGRVSRQSALPKTGFSKVRGCIRGCSIGNTSSARALRLSVLPTKSAFATQQKHVPAVKPAHEFATQTRGNALDPARLEPKRARRIIANRQAAHKSRLKKLGQVGVLKPGLAMS